MKPPRIPPTRFAPGTAPRCHCCEGHGALAALAGADECSWCDDSGRAKHRCPDCGEPQPGCPCWDVGRIPDTPTRHVPRCECGAAGLLFRRGGVCCAKCEVDWLIARERERAPQLAEHEVIARAGELRTRANLLLSWQVRAEQRDAALGVCTEQAERLARENHEILSRRLRAEYRETNRSERRAGLRRLAEAYGVDL